MRYSREKRIIYSVGEDRIDDGGLNEEAPFDHVFTLEDSAKASRSAN